MGNDNKLTFLTPDTSVSQTWSTCSTYFSLYTWINSCEVIGEVERSRRNIRSTIGNHCYLLIRCSSGCNAAGWCSECCADIKLPFAGDSTQAQTTSLSTSPPAVALGCGRTKLHTFPQQTYQLRDKCFLLWEYDMCLQEKRILLVLSFATVLITLVQLWD